MKHPVKTKQKHMKEKQEMGPLHEKIEELEKYFEAHQHISRVTKKEDD